MLLIDSPTISRYRGAPLDYNVRVAKCKQRTSNELFVKQVAQIITNETGHNPLSRVEYRGRKFVESRQIMATILSDYTKGTQELIGMQIGGKNHATVIHSKKTIEDLCETDLEFKEMYDRIETKVKSI